MKILDFIEKDGEGKYSCYKTRKLILDQNDQDTLDYDDKPAVQLNSAQIAESDMSRKETVLINAQMMRLASTPLFSYFLDGSRRRTRAWIRTEEHPEQVHRRMPAGRLRMVVLTRTQERPETIQQHRELP